MDHLIGNIAARVRQAIETGKVKHIGASEVVPLMGAAGITINADRTARHKRQYAVADVQRLLDALDAPDTPGTPDTPAVDDVPAPAAEPDEPMAPTPKARRKREPQKPRIDPAPPSAADRLTSDVVALEPAILKAMENLGLGYVQEVREFIASGGDLTRVPGVDEATRDRIVEAVRE